METVFQIGDTVIYGIHGVCRIAALETQRINKQKVEYFVLVSEDQPGSKFYIPSGNPAALGKLRHLITKAQIDEILSAKWNSADVWIADENQRKMRYKELITGADPAELVGMVRCLHQHRLEQASAGRKFHLCDENFLKDAEKLLSTEFSIVLGIPKDQVGAYVEGAIL